MAGRNFDEATGGKFDYSDSDSGDQQPEQTAFVERLTARVEARFQCYDVKPGSVDDAGNVRSEQWAFTAVYSQDPGNPNFEWSKYPPSAQLSMYVTNEAAFGKIMSGKQYRVLLEEI